MRDSPPLLYGQVYGVGRPFTDAAGREHPQGEAWQFLGAEPVEGGKYNVTELHVENYSYVSNTVVTNYIIEAPQCLIDPQQKTARSAGRIVVSRPDGTFMTTGIGFEFRQIDSLLNISNQVMTHLVRDSFNLRPTYSP